MKVKLYKYTPHIKSFLENPMLRCTPAHDLNDPFELQPNLITLDEFSKVYTGSYLFNDVARFFDLRTSDSGVISLSETKSNLLMWSHYADEHKGAVIEFTFDVEFNTEQKMLQRGFLESIYDNKYLFDRVKYRLEREPDNEVFNTPGYELFLDLKAHLSFTKAEAWSYEKEYRFLCELNSADIICIADSEETRLTLSGFGFSFEKASFNPRLLKLTNYHEHSNDFKKDLERSFKRQELMSTLKKEMKSIFHFYKVKPDSITGIYLGCKSQIDIKSLLSNGQVMDKYKNLRGNVNMSKLCQQRYEMVFEKIA
ncbi:DUF2971 domain-containing protein [Aliivibrio finisterrensis]|uniref:DUF2971 domain-containing protein n=1 Tax=Aliivibrio finisterrensis TaxID=511998 RepID=A0A6N6RPD7_9GAMM|nr:DUF2971 domain-containing protein [Aliivibrio finisterrensis]KAB2823368.1 DUF2971 domain-containing protein [Aliivibrio finisterrensis]